MSANQKNSVLPPVPVVAKGREIAQFFIENLISEHSFFRRGDNRNIGYVSVIMENGRDLDITAFLARLISMTDNIEIRCKLAPQLFDELGAGNSQNIHVKLIGRYLNAVKPYSKLDIKDKSSLENAYSKLGSIYSELFYTRNVNAAIGVAIANELVVQPIFDYIKDITLNSGLPFNSDDLVWITSHNELEDGHVKDSLELAAMLPEDTTALKDAMNAGYKLFAGIWEFFDTVNQLHLN